jgi:RNA polymerase sporulation-specific sigma factor
MNAGSENILLARAASGDSQAVDQLLQQYKGLVRHKAAMMFMPGADREDVIQEGMIGLYKAIRAFDPAKQVPFVSFASYCIMAQITDAVRKSNRQKHQILNESVSLDNIEPSSAKDSSLPLLSVLPDKEGSDPEQALLDREDMAELLDFMQNDLSRLEKKVVLFYIQDLTYEQIAGCLDITEKSVDNAISRARRKFRLYRQGRSQQKTGDDAG